MGFAPSVRKALTVLAVAVFVAFLCLPLCVRLLALDDPEAALEGRRMAPLPHLFPTWLSWRLFPQRFQDYYNDHFGLRPLLLRWQSLLLYKGLGFSSVPSVIAGKDGWLFLGADPLLEDYRGLNLMAPGELERWHSAIVEPAEALARKGIVYLLVIVPDKHTIYPEDLPDYIVRVRQETRFDQVLESLRGDGRIDVLDLRPALGAGKALGRLYARTDTHWNDLGAYVGARAIVERLRLRFPRATMPPLSKYREVTTPAPGGDLARLLGLQADLTEERIALQPIQSPDTRLAPTGLPALGPAASRPEAWETPDAALPHAIVFHDSFAWALKPFLSGRFRRVLFVFQRNLQTDLIAREQPRLVIRIMAERALLQVSPVLIP